MNLAQAFFGGLLVLGIILKLRAKKSAVHQLKPIEPRYHHTAGKTPVPVEFKTEKPSHYIFDRHVRRLVKNQPHHSQKQNRVKGRFAKKTL